MKITKQDKNGDYVTYEGFMEMFLGGGGCSTVILCFVVLWIVAKCAGY